MPCSVAEGKINQSFMTFSVDGLGIVLLRGDVFSEVAPNGMFCFRDENVCVPTWKYHLYPAVCKLLCLGGLRHLAVGDAVDKMGVGVLHQEIGGTVFRSMILTLRYT